MAPGPLREAAGFHYQEFSNLAEPEKLVPDPYQAGDQNLGSVWQEFLIPDTAEVLSWFDDPYWHFPAITRNKYGSGTLTYEATYVSDTLQREIIRNVVSHAGLTGPDQDLPNAVKIRHGRNSQGKALHYYLNFSGKEQTASYSYGDGSDLLTANAVSKGAALKIRPWDLAIIEER
jgi:beta-galactosidase